MENRPPVPLKHSTETALMFVLAVVICLAGYVASLLPDLPQGAPYWLVALIVSAAYGFAMSPFLKNNRADYEFRAMHWFPAGIFLFWILLALIAPHITMARLLYLGAFYLWSLPVTLLSLVFAMIFASHVVRRANLRITVLAILAVLFTIGSVLAENQGWNRPVQATLFPENGPLVTLADNGYKSVAGLFDSMPIGGGSSAAPVHSAMAISSSSFAAVASSSFASGFSSSSDFSVSSSVSSSMSSSTMIAYQQSSSSAAASLSTSRPATLPGSGAETVLMLIGTLGAFYGYTVHRRAMGRV